MAAFCPPVPIDFNTYIPSKYGLFSVVKPFPELDEHWRTCGVAFTSYACPSAEVWIENCTSIPLKGEGVEPNLITADPFTIYSTWSCGVFGKTPEQHRTDAINALLCTEEREVEALFFSGSAADTPQLVGGGCTPLNTTATPYSIASGIGALEGAMGSVQCGEATIHMPRELGALAARFHQTYGAGNTLRTAMGSPIAFGSGYGNASPVGVAPPAGIAWIYATGPVYLAQSEVFMNPPTFEDALNRTNNQLVWEANRTNLLAVDGCACFAVAVSTNGS